MPMKPYQYVCLGKAASKFQAIPWSSKVAANQGQFWKKKSDV